VAPYRPVINFEFTNQELFVQIVIWCDCDNERYRLCWEYHSQILYK